MSTYHVGATPQFRAALHKLERQARGDVFAAAMKVAEGHPSVHVHKLQDSGFVAFGVNQNALRVVCVRDGDLLVMLHVGAHDAAYDWAKRHRTVQVGAMVRFVEVPTELSIEDAAGDLTPEDDTIPPGPLAGLRDRVFARFGIGPHAARTLRRARTEDELIELAVHLAHPVDQAIVGLATAPDDLPAILRAFEEARRSPELPMEVPLARALRADVNAANVWVPTTERALREALAGDLEDWRLFLHPTQQRLVRWRVQGAVKVTGGPGTGKTVVALHRARFLAQDALADDPRPIALAAFSATLAEQLTGLVEGLCAGDPDTRARIEVHTLTALARQVLQEAGKPGAFAASDVLDACWRKALEQEALGWSRRAYEEEREHVLARLGVWTEADYVACTRTGRSTRLDRAAKRKVWRVLGTFEAALARSGAGDGIALAREATAALGAGARGPWAAVVVDEMQDASAAQLRLLAALTRDPVTGQIGNDRLFLCGDGYQRLYAVPVSLASCGIEVRGRSRRLRLNYRTTEGIRRAAIEIVRGLDLDALETLTEVEDTPFDGYRSVRGGPAPVRKGFETAEQEAAWIAGHAGEEPLLVLVRTNTYGRTLADALRVQGQSVHVLEGRGHPSEHGVTLCTLHRSKGLEAPRVVVAGTQEVPGRFPGGDAISRRLHERRERCLLYVGMTRARDACTLTRVDPQAGPEGAQDA